MNEKQGEIMFKKAIFGLVLLISSLFSDVSLGVIGNHGYVEFDSVSEFSADQGENWVAVYQKGASTDWDNVLRWSWIKDLPSHGEKTYDFEFDDLESGKAYELRFFYDNSFDIAQSVDFTFGGSKAFLQIVKYDTNTLSLISSNIDLNTNSWVGIYEKGKSNDWDNVIGWNWVDSTTANNKDYRSTIEGLDLADGVYDVRLFYNNSFDLEASVELVVDTHGNAHKVTRAELDRMIANGEDYSGVDVSGITDMSGLFKNREVQFDITSWDVSNVIDIGYMFRWAISFNQPIEDWDVSSVISMSNMFGYTQAFNQPIGNWNVSSVTDMRSMFRNKQAFNQPIGNWNVGNVTNMARMFNFSRSFNQPIRNWDVSNVTDMNGMFYRSTTFNQNISNWNISKVISHESFYYYKSPFREENQPNFIN